MLSNLADFPAPSAAPAGLAPASVDAWLLAEFDTLAKHVIEGYNRYDFQAVHKSLFDFCNDTLSATYLAAVKDRLYCDRADSPRRRRTQAVLWHVTDGLSRLLAPILCHSADETHRSLYKAAPDDPRCVHLATMLPPTGVAADPHWPMVMQEITSARGELERAKAGMNVDNPLDAGVVLPDPQGALAGFDTVDLADLLGVSEVTLSRTAATPQILDVRARPRCDRSWKRDGTVRQRSDGGMLSDRDAAAVGIT